VRILFAKNNLALLGLCGMWYVLCFEADFFRPICTLALDTFICFDCDAKRPVQAAHSYDHPLLRLHDSAEVKPVEVKSGRLERHLQEMETRINDGLSSIEQKVNVQLDQVKVHMQAVVDEIGKKAPQTRFGSVGIDLEMLPDRQEGDKAKHRPHGTHIVGTHPRVVTSVDEDRIAALESKLDEKFHSLETKVDAQFNLLLSLMRQVVGDVTMGSRT
jgi:hypothetical protein